MFSVANGGTFCFFLIDFIFVAQIPNLTIEIIFMVDVGQLKLVKLTNQRVGC